MKSITHLYNYERSMDQATFISWLSYHFDLKTPIINSSSDAIYFDIWDTRTFHEHELSTFVTNGCDFTDDGQLYMVI